MRANRPPRMYVKQPRRGPLPYVKCPTVTEAYDEFIRTGEFSFGMASDSSFDGKDNIPQFDLDSTVPNQDLLKAAAVAGRTQNQPQPRNESPNPSPSPTPAPAPEAPSA